MSLSPFCELSDVREVFKDFFGPWISEGRERKVIMEAAWDECDDCEALLVVKISFYEDTVSAEDPEAVAAAKQRDLKAEVESAYLKRRLDYDHATELQRMREENRKLRTSDAELRRRITETVGQLKLAVEVMEARDRV